MGHHAAEDDRGTYTVGRKQEREGEGGPGPDSAGQGPSRLRHVRQREQAVFMHTLLHREGSLDAGADPVLGILQQWSFVLNSSPDETMKKLMELQYPHSPVLASIAATDLAPLTLQHKRRQHRVLSPD